ncbi:MAG: FKBP-type peptidyl-prolyl cis-trans isomerase [Bacteroidetes bacterium]|nr:FKBP-type peptidyl-prolyl cis-trans isomerase [Bacteroidota bacterium]
MKWIVFLGIIVFCFACRKQNQIEGYTRAEGGYYYRLLGIGDGNEHPGLDKVCVFDAVMKTQSDSVFWDTEHDRVDGLFVPLQSKPLWGSCQNYYLRMVEGDSVSFLIKPAVFFRDYFDTIVPAFCAHDSLIKINVKLSQIITKAEYKASNESAQGSDIIEDTELEELHLIDCFLKNEDLGYVKPDAYGLYTLEKTTTNQDKVTAGKKVKVAFRGSFIDGRPVDAHEQIMEYIYGTPDQLIKGLNIVIGTLKKGETTKIIVPSRLAFGESGSSNGSIPPYTPLVYHIKIIDIK